VYDERVQSHTLTSTGSNHPQRYGFTSRRFEISPYSHWNTNIILHPTSNYIKEEYAFLCFVKEVGSNFIIPFHVSKAYNVRQGLHSHRFIFLDKEKFDGSTLMLVERSGEAYTRPDFNVELHYLELKNHELGTWRHNTRNPILYWEGSLLLQTFPFVCSNDSSCTSDQQRRFANFSTLRYSTDLILFQGHAQISSSKTCW